MRMINLAFLIILSMVIPSPVSAESGEDPRWLISLKSGQGEMLTESWDTTYSKKTDFNGIEAGWKYSRQFGINVGVSHSSSSGKAKTLSGRVSNDVLRTQLMVVDISFVFRLAFFKNQIVVPYAATGYSQTFYRIDINGNEIIGDQNGYHLKGGLLFLLDSIEPERADEMKTRFLVGNTYLFAEYYQSKVDDFGSGVNDLGSKCIAGGLVFEF